MQNYYFKLEELLSLVSHNLSIVKYVILKKIICFFLCFDCLIWTWTWLGLKPLGLGLDLDSNLLGLGLDLDSIVLVLDSTKVDLATALWNGLWNLEIKLATLISI